jgi:hypothetical protein
MGGGDGVSVIFINPYRFAAGGGLWTPAALTTALWLDAADNSTVFSDAGVTQASNGSGVWQWNDKSGNNRHATQSSSGSQPLFTTAAQNGQSILVFNGSPRTMLIASTPLFGSGGSQEVSIFAAYRPKVTSTYGTLFGNYTAGNMSIYYGGGISWLEPWGIYHDTMGAVDIDSGSYVPNEATIIGLVRQGGFYTGYRNGSTKNQRANTNSFYTGSNTKSVWRINSNTVPSEYGNMDLYELICVNQAVSGTQVQQVEGYLAHKWGLTANLPSNHPYKTAAPTV